MPARYDGPCRKCGGPVVRDGQGERKCPACFVARKRVERQRAADRAGKPYHPGVPFWQASRINRGLPPDTVCDATWRRIEARNARQAWRWWLDRAPAWWLAARAEVAVERDSATYRDRYRSDPAFRASEIRRVAERKARRGRFDEMVRLVLRGERGDAAMRRAIGYGRAELLAHLVSRFRPGMTVELLLAGEIHVDHDEPVARFDPSDPAQLRHLWRIENVQPLWPHENCRKGARTIAEWQGAKELPLAA